MCCSMPPAVLRYGFQVPVRDKSRCQRSQDHHVLPGQHSREKAAEYRALPDPSECAETDDADDGGDDHHDGIRGYAHLAVVLLHTHGEGVCEPVSGDHDNVGEDLEVHSECQDGDPSQDGCDLEQVSGRSEAGEDPHREIDQISEEERDDDLQQDVDPDHAVDGRLVREDVLEGDEKQAEQDCEAAQGDLRED